MTNTLVGGHDKGNGGIGDFFRQSFARFPYGIHFKTFVPSDLPLRSFPLFYCASLICRDVIFFLPGHVERIPSSTVVTPARHPLQAPRASSKIVSEGR
jgi:hypothetical protein